MGIVMPAFAAALHKVEVGVGVVEELGKRSVGPSFHLAAEVFEVLSGARRLRMHLRVSGDFDLEGVAMLLADEADQLVGVVEFAGRSGAHRRGRQIAAQRHDALDARFAVARKLRRNVGARRANAGEVRRGLHAAVLHHRQQGFVRAFLVRPARAVGHGEVVGPQRRQLADHGRQLGHALRRARRKQLERECMRRVHSVGLIGHRWICAFPRSRKPRPGAPTCFC